MDRRSEVYRRWQVDLPVSVRYAELVSRINYALKLRADFGAVLGIAAFVVGGGVVVTGASLIALAI